MGIKMTFTLFCREFGNVVNRAFLVLIFWIKKLVGANLTRFCNYATSCILLFKVDASPHWGLMWGVPTGESPEIQPSRFAAEICLSPSSGRVAQKSAIIRIIHRCLSIRFNAKPVPTVHIITIYSMRVQVAFPIK